MSITTMRGRVAAATLSVREGTTLIMSAGSKLSIGGVSIEFISTYAFHRADTEIDPNAGHEHSVELQGGVITPGTLTAIVDAGNAVEIEGLGVIDGNSSFLF